MRIGAVGHHFSMIPLPKAISVVEGLGADFFELSGIPSEAEYGRGEAQVDLSPFAKGWAEVKTLFDSSNLKVHVIGGYNDFALLGREELKREKDRVLRACEAANFFGVDVVRVFAGDVKNGVEREELIAQIIDCYREIMPRVAEYGIYLAIENHMHLVNDGPTLLKILEEVGSGWLKVTLDMGNFYWVGHSLKETYEYIRMLAPYTVHTHLKNVTKVNGKRKLVELGEGDIDTAFTVQELLKVGYDRPFTVAYEGDFSNVQTVSRGVKKSLDYLRLLLRDSDERLREG